MLRPAPLALLLLTAAGATTGRAAPADEQALAERWAPIVRLVAQPESCGPGEPFSPLDVDAVFGEPTVALRGPWNAVDLVSIGPTAAAVAGLWEYHLDFFGNALDPRCDYERWSRRLAAGRPPTVYAHVATDPAHPGKLALQYWLFYAYNDWNNLHEGDWEMLQLVFEAAGAREALARAPAAIGLSQHEGAEGAEWGDDKVELVDGRPVVYPAAGSHANFFAPALHLGSSPEAGVGCDDTRGPHVEVRPRVVTIPSDPAAARAALPWIAFEGRWGEMQPAFFNGPTGPNLKPQWTAPIAWAAGWRPRSYAVPTGGAFGTRATDFFCTAVAGGSRGLVRAVRAPSLVLPAVAALLALGALVASRTRWRPAAPLHLAHRRAWGQLLAAAGGMYVAHPTLFLGIGLLFIPLGLAISVVQALVLGGFGLLGVDASGETAGALALGIAAIGTMLTLLGLAVLQAATATALLGLDAGRPASALAAYRAAVGRLPALAGGLAAGVAVWAALSATAVLIPVAVWLAVRWSLFAQVVAVEGGSGRAALARSAALVRGRWLRVASLVGVCAPLALVAGPLLGAVLILLTDVPLALLNVVAGIVYALVMPLVALVTSYVYADARARHAREPGDPETLPAEADLALTARSAR